MKRKKILNNIVDKLPSDTVQFNTIHVRFENKQNSVDVLLFVATHR